MAPPPETTAGRTIRGGLASGRVDGDDRDSGGFCDPLTRLRVGRNDAEIGEFRREETRLRCLVALEVTVEIEMVDAEVGEDPDGEAGAANPMQVKCVARDLHRHRGVTLPVGLGQDPLQFWCLRRGSHTGERADLGCGGAELFEQITDQPNGRGLAVGPGDADDRDVRRRVAVDGGSRRTHRFTDARHDKLRYSHVEAMFDEHGDGTGLDGRRRVVMAVGCLAGNTGEEVTRPGTPRVVLDIDDVDDRSVGLDHCGQ